MRHCTRRCSIAPRQPPERAREPRTAADRRAGTGGRALARRRGPGTACRRHDAAPRAARRPGDTGDAAAGPTGRGRDAVALPGLDDALRDGRLETRFVPYVTFPFAGRRGTTILDRITAYPYFGRRAGRVAQRLVEEGRAQIVHGLGASALGYAQARARDRIGTVPFIFNPQGLEEFGGTDPSRARVKTLAYRPLRAAVGGLRRCGRPGNCDRRRAGAGRGGASRG